MHLEWDCVRPKSVIALALRTLIGYMCDRTAQLEEEGPIAATRIHWL